MKKKICLLIILAAIFTGCGDESVTEEKIPYVKTQKVVPSSVSTENIYSGTVCGRYETNMAFQVSGKIFSRNVEVGSQVFAGDLLMSIDSKDILQQANQGDAQVNAALAQLKLAESDLNRYRQLFNEDAISAAMLDQYQTNYDAALANYKNAQAVSRQGHNALSYTNLTANTNGVISEINAEVGQVISAGQTVLTLVQTDELEIEINLPENKISEIGIGDSAEISFWANPDKVTGIVREISPIADSAARTYKVRISLPNLREGIYLGMTASAAFPSKNLNPNYCILPLSAIYQTENQPQVWTVSAGKLQLKNITVQEFSGNEVAVLGLNAGEIVVTAGVHKLREGQEVRIKD